MKKRVKVGDLFLISMEDGRFAVGQVVGKWLSALTLVVFDRLVESQEDIDGIRRIASDDSIKFVALALDAMLYVGHWPVITNMPINPNVRLPAYQVTVSSVEGAGVIVEDALGERARPARASELALVPQRIVISPYILELAVKADLGLGEWEDSYDKLRARNIVAADEVFGPED